MQKRALSAGPTGVAGMLRGYSMELLPTDSRTIDAAITHLEPGTVVSLTWIPGSNPMAMVSPAARLRRAGLFVMPHIGARHLESAMQLRELAERFAGDAGVDRVLIIGGDRARPAGPFDSTLAVMQAGAFQRVGIVRIAIAGFPEGNPHIPEQTLHEAMAAKVAFAHEEGIRLSVVTQFCFRAEPIVSWLGHIRDRGIHVPVRIGLAGPASVLTLIRYAVRCGIGKSLHVLTDNPSFAKSLVDRGPEPIIRDLAAAINENGTDLGIAGLHFYIFGGFGRTFNWIEAAQSHKPVAYYT